MSHNGLNRPTDRLGPQNRTPGWSRLRAIVAEARFALCVVEPNTAKWTTVHAAVQFLISWIWPPSTARQSRICLCIMQSSRTERTSVRAAAQLLISWIWPSTEKAGSRRSGL